MSPKIEDMGVSVPSGPVLSLRQKAALASALYLGLCMILLVVAQPNLVAMWGEITSPQPTDCSGEGEKQELMTIYRDDFQKISKNCTYVETVNGETFLDDGHAYLRLLEATSEEAATACIMEREKSWLYVCLDVKLRLSDEL